MTASELFVRSKPVPSHTVLINLRVPSLTVRPAGEAPKRVDNSEVRFRKAMELATLAKPGEILEISVAEGSAPLACTVNSVNWDERENMFIVACYAKPPLRESDYRALLASPEWEMKALL